MATRRADGSYSVDSYREEGKSYRVDPIKGQCSCPHYVKRLAGTNKSCKHLDDLRAELAQQTALGRAADKAANLTEQELRRALTLHKGDAAQAACLLELACRRRQAQAENQPEVDLAHHTCTCREFTERRDGKRIGVLFVTCRHLQAARKLAAVQPEPKPIPAGVEAFLVGASEAERERALAIYR